MSFKIDRTITITGEDANRLPIIFDYAKGYMEGIIKDNPDYSSRFFGEALETIARFQEFLKWEDCK